MTCAMLAPAAPALGAAGDLDPSFGGDGVVVTNLTPGNDAANAVAIQADGKVVVAGRTTGGGGQVVVARYAAAGLLDPTFSGDGIARTNLSHGNDEATGLAIQPDGKIVVAATAGTPGTNSLFAVLRYDPDGRLDRSFSRDGRVAAAVPGGGVARAVSLQADGRIVVAGSAGAHSIEFAVVRFRPDGAVDTSFGGDGTVVTTLTGSFDFGEAVAVQPNGRVIVAGFAGAGRYGLVRYTAAGALDTTFSGNGKAVLPVGGFASAIALHGGKIVLAGGVPLDRMGVVRVNADGTLDRTFGRRGVARTAFPGFTTTSAAAVAIQPDGKIVAAGFASSFRGRGDFALARYTAVGALDPTFGGDGRVHTAFPPGGRDSAAGVALQADGRIVAVGRAAGHGGRLALARYLG